MITVSFPNWSDALSEADLPEKTRKSFEISIKWYLGFLAKKGVPASVESAREFIETNARTRKPEEWMLEQWRAALNWFFRHAPHRRNRGDRAAKDDGWDHGQAGGADEVDGRQSYPVTVRQYQERVESEPLIEETVRLMRVRHLAYRTEEAYIGWLRRMDRFVAVKGMSLEEFGQDDLKAFLSHLAVEEGVSAATQRQALNAGVFFLREVRKFELGDFSDFVAANPRKYYPVVYSKGEIQRLLEKLSGQWQLMARLQYGCGLRISELCRLRVKDVDIERGKLFIRAGKGDKDRVVPLPRSIMNDWRRHLEGVRKVHEADRRKGAPGVFMPDALDRKMSKAAASWEWFWAFPANDLSVDPRNKDAPPRRHHALPKVYQRSLTRAAREADIPKRSNSHVLRHSYATHLLENGVNIRTVQEFLGHQCVETTMIYLHVMEDQTLDCLSPLDRL